jgi:predicted transcriptional regulator
MGKTVTVRVDDTTYKKIKAAAEAERRTISNFMEYATINYVEQSSFVDDEEMVGILENEVLLKNLKNAMGDIKNRKYRIVE